MEYKKSIFLTTFLCLFLNGIVVSQYQFATKDDTITYSPGDLSIQFVNSNFIKNNEYFNEIVEGYTLFGFWATPSLVYKITEKSQIEGGIHLLKFDGHDQFFKTLPVFRFDHHFNQNVEMVFGTIKNNSNHQMPAMMYDPESFYFNQADNGIQFLISSKRFSSDIWLSWDKFSFYGDSLQEEITFGTSNCYEFQISSTFNIKLPVFITITHKGGQLNRPKKPIETLINIGSGLEVEFKPNDRFIKSLSLAPNFFIYNKNTSDTSRPFKNGWALYPAMSIGFEHFYVEGGYWYSNGFIGPRGEAIYQLQSLAKPGYYINNSKLLVSKIKYKRQLSNQILIAAGFEGYYNSPEKLFDYNFSLQINCLLNWKLGNFPIKE